MHQWIVDVWHYLQTLNFTPKSFDLPILDLENHAYTRGKLNFIEMGDAYVSIA